MRITVGGAGTGDGVDRFCRGDTVVATASRLIEDDEAQACEQGNVGFQELQVANDGIAVVANPDTQIPENCMTVAQLRRLLRPGSQITNLSDLGQGFPDQQLAFFTPGEESGTFDYFTEAVLETDAAQRTEQVQTSANDNQLVQGVEGTAGALGYFGFSFADENRERLNILSIREGDGECVEPSVETIQDGSYQPLSRPLFLYPSEQALARPEVRAFMDFVLENHQQISEAADIVPMTQQQAAESSQALEAAGRGQ